MKTGKTIGVLVLAFACAISARVYSPWVNSDLVPDWSGNWESFKHYSTLDGKTNQDLAIGVFNIFTDKSLGIMHVGGTGEPFINSSYDYTNLMCYKAVRDPVKIMNIASWGWCGQEGSNMAAAMQQAGLGPTRDMGWGGDHGLMEVYYSGSWHYFDADVRGYVMNPNNNLVASAQEVTTNHSWVQDSDFNCSDDAQWVRDRPTWPGSDYYFYYHRLWTSSHTMDFVLRMGETFTRYWKADSTRYYNSPDWYNGFPHIGNNILTTSYNGIAKDNGMPCHGRPENWCNGYHWPVPGMGIYQYAPNLSSDYDDYEDGVTVDSNIVQDQTGVGAPAGQNGYVIFDRFTPYILCGKNGLNFTNLQNQTGQTDGGVLTIDLTGNANVRVSRNNGHTWTTLGTNVTGAQTYDFTQSVYGFWQYMIRIDLLNGAKLTQYQEKATVSASPGSLPSINGTTQMHYRVGDRYGFQTKTYLMDLDLRDNAANLPATLTGHTPTSITARATQAVVKVNPPGNGKIRWISFGGAFNRTANPGMEISLNGSTYTSIWSVGSWSSCPYLDCHWLIQYDTAIVFTTGAPGSTQDWNRAFVLAVEPPESLWVRYTNNVNMVRIYAHYEEPDRLVKNSTVSVTHATSSGTFEQDMSADQSYAVSSLTGTNLWYRMEVASEPASGIAAPSVLVSSEMLEAMPNPFNPATTIRLHTPSQLHGSANLAIYTIEGIAVERQTVKAADLEKGFVWNAGNLPSGVYMLRLTVPGGAILTKQLILMK